MLPDTGQAPAAETPATPATGPAAAAPTAEEPATEAKPTATAEPTAEKPAAEKLAAGKPAATEPAPAETAAPPIANYEQLTVASLRARLRGLTIIQVRELIVYERAHAARPDVIAMFERRVTKLEAPEG
jgi:hypothetical protein